MKEKDKETKLYFYLVSMAYDGNYFNGWAVQPGLFTVQGYIESMIKKTFKQKIPVLAASRTDKGVHACDQKFTLRLPFYLSAKRLKKCLAAVLNKHVLVKNVHHVDSNFHPIRDVVEKEYRYYINTGEYDLFKSRYRWEYNHPLRTTRLNKILNIFKGTNDLFNFCFCKFKDRDKTSTVRKINHINSWKRGNILIIKIKSCGFLRYQIRAIIGESINCYKGKQNIESLKEKLRNFHGQEYKYKALAPASGLYLWKVNYKKLNKKTSKN